MGAAQNVLVTEWHCVNIRQAHNILKPSVSRINSLKCQSLAHLRDAEEFILADWQVEKNSGTETDSKKGQSEGQIDRCMTYLFGKSSDREAGKQTGRQMLKLGKDRRKMDK